MIYAGASVAAAKSLTQGTADIAINWMGGQTHARRDCAAGFSYVNDVVLAILALLKSFDRVMFVNVDAWHPSGVEEAFFTTDRVLSLSLHRYGEGLFPGSGGMADIGEGEGKNYTINIPVMDGFDDTDVETLFLPVLNAAAARFQPHAIICCAGAGVIAGDRLGCLNMTLASHSAILHALMELELPMLVLGSGGFTQLNASRTYCNATATLCGIQLPDAIPPHVFRDDYLPDYKLTIPRTVMANMNTPESLSTIKSAAMLTISRMTSRMSMKPVAPFPGPIPGSAQRESGMHAVSANVHPSSMVKSEMLSTTASAGAVKMEIDSKHEGMEKRSMDSLKGTPMDVEGLPETNGGVGRSGGLDRSERD